MPAAVQHQRRSSQAARETSVTRTDRVDIPEQLHTPQMLLAILSRVFGFILHCPPLPPEFFFLASLVLSCSNEME
ncbi:hypothetical protein IRJ41_003768 [Triplophysa rosa]|uniref:Uncharacterized protein n=1 Tax=Triplophysa rosa TaxID=992332 RepID=A0A9W8C9M0_TRIRA|nr:hypothetical protein IRJ41_003768 [Triplophysa rosa]